IDIMKPASLGFVTPGMRTEYHVSAGLVSWLPFAALAGTVVGSCLWGVMADIYGRRASIVLSSVLFVGTSICGAMTAFGWKVALSPLIPESARFLQQMGRADLARATLARFGVELSPASVVSAAAATEPESHAPVPPVGRGFLGVTAALTLAALAWGLVNFGLLLWLPAALIAEGRSVGASSALIARSTLIAAPTIVVCAWLFSAWSTKWSLVAMTGVM